MFNDKYSHEFYLKRIGSYMNATHEKGLIMITCHKKNTDTTYVNILSVHVITLADCTVIWK